MSEDSPEELASSRYASLVQTRRGYEVRRRGRAATDTFPSTDEGFDAAWDLYEDLTRAGRSGRLLSFLVIIGVAAGSLWFLVVLVANVAYVALIHSRSADPLGGLLSWISPFTTVFYALFAGATGSYAVVWLYRRGMPPVRSRR